MPAGGVVRKNVRLTQGKIDRARKILGTKTETETIEQALDLVAYRQEVVAGIERIAGSGAIETSSRCCTDGSEALRPRFQPVHRGSA